MSNSLVEFLKRLSTDMSFKSLAETQPEVALAGYQMSGEEQNALRQLLTMSPEDRKHYMVISPNNSSWW